ncbi:hypothetical protein [Roseivirga misakiensis]|uniref:Uncharacterized protein n=1 Tax=Roseivirga misakiensis TaxID=1563681 RepID=A0A1E5T714_9BACT|nr:hypothetical protein [Roseivirga misakiensis]OEK07172.1 hypothetical protein BFP71_05815 [Roseivirga misakiensis]
MNRKQKTGLVLSFVLFLLLLNKPLIAIPNAIKGGLPNVMIYLLIVWLVIIITMIIFSLKSSKTDD